jgi:predicted AAA+ superfamily ATPase
MNKLIIRRKYLENIKPYIGKQIIKILIGQRRVGKSYILLQTIEEIKSQDATANILYINKEDFQFDKIKTANDLYEYVQNNTNDKVKNYIFIDEIQEIKEFEDRKSVV